MKPLARCLWLLAWAGWLWLGVGLYRELPREYGEPIARLPFRNRSNLRFIGNTNRISMLKSNQAKTSIEVYDGETGALVFESPEQKVGEYLWLNPYNVDHPAQL